MNDGEELLAAELCESAMVELVSDSCEFCDACRSINYILFVFFSLSSASSLLSLLVHTSDFCDLSGNNGYFSGDPCAGSRPLSIKSTTVFICTSSCRNKRYLKYVYLAHAANT
jgi:hypothetical protein